MGVVGLDAVEHVVQHAAQAVAAGFVQAVGKRCAARAEYLPEQGFKQVFFVFEMPVERVARYAGVAGDGGQRGAGDAVFEEGIEGGLHELFAGFLCFFFGFAHGCRREMCVIVKIRAAL